MGKYRTTWLIEQFERAYFIITISNRDLEPQLRLYLDTEKELAFCRTLERNLWARCPTIYLFATRRRFPVGEEIVDFTIIPEGAEAYLRYDLFRHFVLRNAGATYIYVLIEPLLEYRFYCDVYEDCHFSIIAYYQDWLTDPLGRIIVPVAVREEIDLSNVRRVLEVGEILRDDDTVYLCARFRSSYEAKEKKGSKERETYFEFSAVKCVLLDYGELKRVFRECNPASCDEFKESLLDESGIRDEMEDIISQFESPVTPQLITSLETEEVEFCVRDCSMEPIVTVVKWTGRTYTYRWNGSTWVSE